MKSVGTGANAVCLTDSTDTISSLSLSLIYEQMLVTVWNEKTIFFATNQELLSDEEKRNRRNL